MAAREILSQTAEKNAESVDLMLHAAAIFTVSAGYFSGFAAPRKKYYLYLGTLTNHKIPQITLKCGGTFWVQYRYRSRYFTDVYL